MDDLEALEQAKKIALLHYQNKKQLLASNPHNLAQAAQAVNDAWLQYKQAENNYVYKKGRELYGLA